MIRWRVGGFYALAPSTLLDATNLRCRFVSIAVLLNFYSGKPFFNPTRSDAKKPATVAGLLTLLYNVC